ncbi:sigma-70 family RNA polymerase sigma factor [Myxacorys almedinensis]|uniref:Sigma-70 family RNA polymerase sigma factor n=1 Tax=Myxacorys almedinensis A TaxID=2690445 RepID=A0A8J7Z3S4_9CYAN|nr:sigma-70 family RNA polymerase sigma factor [Myxacorys almedinensis]NDJ18775.1 sigma-70 family RNA polymerase sigma factor [Myxacorys almedinensis A]
MDELTLYLQSLIQEACSHLPATPQRRKAINLLLRVLLKSGRLETKRDDLYEDALYKTMFNLTETLCDKYDPSRGSFLAWFNTCLRNQHRDELRAAQRHRDRKQSAWQGHEVELDPLDQVASPIDANLLLDTWKSFVQWIKDDPDHRLKACHIENNPEANCQSLAYLRLVVGKEWQEIAAEVGSTRGAISSHWSRKCQPLLQEWLTQNQRLFGEESYDR